MCRRADQTPESSNEPGVDPQIAAKPGDTDKLPLEVCLEDLLVFIDPARLHGTIDDERAIDPRPLGETEAELFQRLLRTLRKLGYLVQDNDAKIWRLGRSLYLIYISGFWRRDPTYQGRSFFEFASRMTGCTSRTKLDRLRIIGEHYTCEDFLELRKLDIGTTQMAELYRADARLWDALRAAQRTGTKGHELALMRAVGETELLKQDEEDEKSEEQRLAEVVAKMARARVLALKQRAQQDKRRGSKDPGRRRNGERGEAGALDPEEAQRLAQAEREALARTQAEAERRLREAEALQQKLAEQEAGVRAQQQTVADQEAALQQRAGQLAEQEAALQQRAGQAAQEEAALREREGRVAFHEEAHKEAQEGGVTVAQVAESRLAQAQSGLRQIQQERAALADHVKEMEVRHTETQKDLQARQADLTQQQSALAAAQTDLAAREQHLQEQLASWQERLKDQQAQTEALAAREQELQARHLSHEEAAQALERGRAELRTHQQELLDVVQSLQDQQEELAKERHRIEQMHSYMMLCVDEFRRTSEQAQKDRQRLEEAEFSIAWLTREERGLTWPDVPLGVDCTMLCAYDHLGQALSLIRQAREHIEKGRLPEPHRGVPLLLLVDNAFQALREVVPGALDAIHLPLTLQDPREAARFLEAYQRDPAAALVAALGKQPVMPRKSAPGLKFARPIRATLGTDEADTPQEGVLGVTEDGKELVTVDMNHPQAYVIAGQIGYGKTSTTGVVAENGQPAKENICNTQVEYMIMTTHYDSDANGMAPRWANYFKPNDEKAAVVELDKVFGAVPQGFRVKRQIVIVPPLDEELMEKRRQEYPGMELRTLTLGKKRLTREVLRLVMGTHKKSPLYMMKVGHAMDTCKSGKPKDIIAAIRKLKFHGEIQDIVEARLVLLEKLLGEEDALEDLGPGDFVGLDMRAPYLDETQALGIFAMLTAAVSNAKRKVMRDGKEVEETFMKMIIFDESHKYMGHGTVTKDIVLMLREMRHRRTTVVFACQDPDTLHPALLKLSTIQIVHQIKSIASLRALAAQCAGWDLIDIEDLAALDKGWAYVMTTACKNKTYRKKPQKTKIRPTCAKPTGTTLTAIPTN